MSITKPMLAASMEDSKGNPVTFAQLKYPLLASIKLDGIRCLREDNKTLSRKFKLIKNNYVREMTKDLPNGLDGELTVVGAEFNNTSSGIMSADGEPDFIYWVFDYVKDDLEKPYSERIKDLKALKLPSFCKKVIPKLIKNEQELREYEEKALADGHEGIMVRSLDSPYKCGRSTFNQGYLIKIKRFVDSEAVILNLEEKMHNENEATLDELGHTKRSSAKDGLVPAGTLGTLIVRDIHDNREFRIGTGVGLDDKLRQAIWDDQKSYIGKIIKYKYQEVGTVDKPRIPSFQGFRDEDDMGE